ncbi:unnamed protein product [Allacma fusca]|uniref:Uncharacterized protein n=1 Tax=Allacma fusca TaxID=39272 RepID=A0A8J2JKN4_9HEXA|nr:unnamed protein product [Allacma fusca]
MEKDRDFENIQKWYTPADLEEGLAFEYLCEVVKNIFMGIEEGVKLSELTEFLQLSGFTLDMVRAVRFFTLQHFLFHLDNILEVRGKKIDGRIFYFAFIKETLRRESRKLVDISDEKLSSGRVYHRSSFPASYSKVLNLHRDIISATVTLTAPSVVPPSSNPNPFKTDLMRDKTSSNLVSERPLRNQNDTVAAVPSSALSRPETVQKILRTHVFGPPDSRSARYRIPSVRSSFYKGETIQKATTTYLN